MKSKLLSLSLALIMLISCVLTGCSPSENEGGTDSGETEVDNSAKSITLWLIAEEGMTPKAQELVSEAFTEITKSAFNTNVVLRFCSEDTYYDQLEKAINDSQERAILLEECQKAFRKFKKQNADSGKDIPTLTKEFYEKYPEYAQFYNSGALEEDEEGEETTEVEEETVVNDLGIIETKYPEVAKDQVDIFYLSGYDKYTEYIDKEWLTELNSEISSASKKLSAYISVSLPNGVQVDGGVYAVPNNVPIGEYTYMMVDKEYFDDYYNKMDNVSNVVDISRFLNDVKNMNIANGVDADDEGYVVPLESTFEECMKMLVWYWDLAYTDISVYETHYDEENGREYVLYSQYTVEVEVIDEATGEPKEDENGDPITEKVFQYAPVAEYDKTYKINSNGQYLDKDGNVLNYSYAYDCEYDENGNPTSWKAWWMDMDGEGPYDNLAAQKVAADDEDKDLALSNLKGMYLVDEDGNPVTKENDKRVIVNEKDSTNFDDNGNVKPSYFYTYEKSSDFSVLGTVFKSPDIKDRGKVNVGFNSLLEDKNYQELYLTMKNYEYEGFFGAPAEGQSSAVFFKKGDAKIKVENDKNGYYVDPETGREYYAVVAEYPEATDKELYGNMFAVYANSPNLTRAMEVITRINTNAELRNLLQYGILDQHYELNEDGTVKLLTSSEKEYGTYRMDIYKTGNCFIAHPTEELGADVWKYAMIQNSDSLIAPLLGFDFNDACSEEEYPLDVSLIDYIDTVNAAVIEKIDSCRDIDELENALITAEDSLVNKYSKRYDSKIAKAANSNYDPDEPLGSSVANQKPDLSGNSPNTIYYRWLETYGYKAAN